MVVFYFLIQSIRSIVSVPLGEDFRTTATSLLHTLDFV